MNDFMDDQSYIEALHLIGQLAPTRPINQDEQGGCVWCGGGPPRQPWGYATDNPKHHSEDCPWLAADRLLKGHPEIDRSEEY